VRGPKLPKSGENRFLLAWFQAQRKSQRLFLRQGPPLKRSRQSLLLLGACSVRPTVMVAPIRVDLIAVGWSVMLIVVLVSGCHVLLASSFANRYRLNRTVCSRAICCFSGSGHRRFHMLRFTKGMAALFTPRRRANGLVTHPSIIPTGVSTWLEQGASDSG